MKTLDQISIIVENCQFRDWKFLVGLDDNRPFLQLKWTAPNNDNIHGPIESQVSRKWWLSFHMCENELVRTAHKAVAAAMEHEMNEQFTFRGQRIFDPHMDYTKLAGMIQMGFIPNNNRE